MSALRHKIHLRLVKVTRYLVIGFILLSSVLLAYVTYGKKNSDSFHAPTEAESWSKGEDTRMPVLLDFSDEVLEQYRNSEVIIAGFTSKDRYIYDGKGARLKHGLDDNSDGVETSDIYFVVLKGFLNNDYSSIGGSKNLYARKLPSFDEFKKVASRYLSETCVQCEMDNKVDCISGINPAIKVRLIPAVSGDAIRSILATYYLDINNPDSFFVEFDLMKNNAISRTGGSIGQDQCKNLRNRGMKESDNIDLFQIYKGQDLENKLDTIRVN